jgi:7-keto-8-aminopelargonate synthetase-like enzyme
MIEPEPLQQINRTYVRYKNRTLTYFSGCDYFRLSSHPKVLAAVGQALERYGLNVAASRLTTGNHTVYRELEKQLAAFFSSESATLVSTGYNTNLIVAQALAGNFSHALADERSHPSFADAARFLDCPVLKFKHQDPEDLGRCVARCGPGTKLLVMTDGLFAQNGSAAPLNHYLKILPKDALILVDDAHGAGVLGRTGQGTLQHVGVGRRRIIQTLTLSKAFGAYGGAILGARALRQRILDCSRLFLASTPLPLPLANAALTSVDLLRRDTAFRQRLLENATYLKNGFRQMHLLVPDQPGPILPLLPKNKRQAESARNSLLKANIYPPFIRYPGGPDSGYFRFVISSEHTREQLDALVDCLVPFGKAGAKFSV